MKKLSELYEEAAKERGYKDWNTLCGLVSEAERLQIKDSIKKNIDRFKKEKRK